MCTHDMSGTVPGTGTAWELCLSLWSWFFFLKQGINCVVWNKTVENTDPGKVASHVTSGSSTFQGLLGSAIRPVL